MTKYTHLPASQIAELYEREMMSENAIAKVLNVSRTVIRSRLIEAGIHIRSQSEAETLKWKFMSREQRKHQIKAYHDKIRGGTRSHESLVKRAKSVQDKCKLSGKEIVAYNTLLAIGIPVVPLYAVDIFNIDFADVDNKIAFELNTGGWHNTKRKKAQDTKKAEYLKSQGWDIITIPDFTPQSCKCYLVHP